LIFLFKGGGEGGGGVLPPPPSVVPPKSESAVKPLRASKPVIQAQTPDSEKIRYTTRDARGVNVQQQDWYEPMGYPNQDVYENPV